MHLKETVEIILVRALVHLASPVVKNLLLRHTNSSLQGPEQLSTIYTNKKSCVKIKNVSLKAAAETIAAVQECDASKA